MKGMINLDSEVLKVIATASEEPQSVFWDGLFVVWSPGAGTGRTGSHPTRYTWRFAWNRLFIVHQRAASGLPKSKWRRPWPTASFTAIFTRWAISRDHPEVKDVRCFNCASHKIWWSKSRPVIYTGSWHLRKSECMDEPRCKISHEAFILGNFELI